MGPLIADRRTARSAWLFGGDNLRDSRATADCYARYVTTCEAWAIAINCGPTDVERALFELGSQIERTWKVQSRT